MAIRFVDVKPDEAEGARPAPARRARAPEVAPEKARDAERVEPEQARPEPDAHEPTGAGAAPGDGEPVLPHAKPEPKPRGRKKSMSAVGADERSDDRAARPGAPEKPDAPSAPLLEGLLPELQAHAKPTPKPRGRKKAFG